MRVATDNASVNSIFYALLSVIKHRNLSNTHNAHKNTRLITSIEGKKNYTQHGLTSMNGSGVDFDSI